MNKEIKKAIRKQEKKHTIRKWWRKNSYKVARIIFWPIWLYMVIEEKYKAKKYKSLEWSEERAQEALAYYIPRYADWDVEEKRFYFADNGMGWTMREVVQKCVKRKNRAWWKKYASGWGGRIREYLIDTFELEGFTKTVEDTCDGWTEITFTLNEKEG